MIDAHPFAAVAAALLLALAPPAVEDDAAAEAPIALGTDRAARMTVPVGIDGSGPYHFTIDTGAERTMISAELARALNLDAGRTTRLHSMSGAGDVDTVVIPTLRLDRKVVKGINAPVLGRRDLGAEGMLGVDSLQRQRVLFDFAAGTMSIGPAPRVQERYEPGTIVVTARSRFGRLILADARVDGQKVWVILDTGSQVSIGNLALKRQLQKRRRFVPGVPIDLISVTGGRVPADYTKVNGLIVGGVTLTDMAIAFADVHPFAKLGLDDRPAVLLGMDALRAFERVSVDFANKKVRFVLRDQSMQFPPARLKGTRIAAR